MKVVVGTGNPVKVAAVRRAFSRLGIECEVLGVRTVTSVGPQPVGLRTIVRGAVERALGALRSSESDYGVGIEAGFVEVPGTVTGYMNFQACAVVDGDLRVSLGMGPGFEFPTEAVNSVMRGEVAEVGVFMERLTGVKGIGSREGAVGYLSRGVVTRSDITEMAVIMAMIPRLNPSLYASLPGAPDLLEQL